EDGEPRPDRPCRIGGRRAQLQDAQPAADDGHQVGERPSGVDADEERPPAQEVDFSLAGLSPPVFVSVLVSVFVSVFPSDFFSPLLSASPPASFLPPLPPAGRA